MSFKLIVLNSSWLLLIELIIDFKVLSEYSLLFSLNTLSLDWESILIEAQVGKKRTSSRLEISNDINNIILSPLRLSTPQVYDQAKKLLINAQKISNPGAKHLKQLSQLKQALEDSQVDLQVLFRSDRSTNVTLLKKGNLGYFIEKNLILKPGNYIATGTRDGYRDIRIEFRVSKESAPFNIEVTCKEQI